MRDRRKHHDALARISQIRHAERGALRQQLYDADVLVREAQETCARADRDVARADEAWRAGVSGPSYHPELARALAGVLVTSANALGVAREAESDACESRNASEASLRVGEARCRQVEQAFRESRRGLARARDERTLERLADRISYKWRRA